MKPVRKKQIHSYLLFELLIALAILGMALGPLITSSCDHLKRQKNTCFFLNLHREADKLLVQLEESLRTGEVSWEKIMQATSKTILLKTAFLQKEPINIYMKVQKSKIAKDESAVMLVVLTVQFPKKRQSKQKKLYPQPKLVLCVSKKQQLTPIKSPSLAMQASAFYEEKKT
jgi:hypothetical protein